MNGARSANFASDQQRLIGIFFCPGCTLNRQEPVNFPIDQIQVLMRFWGTRHFIHTPQLCPECRRPMWLENIIEPSGKIIFSFAEWIQAELQRLRDHHQTDGPAER